MPYYYGSLASQPGHQAYVAFGTEIIVGKSEQADVGILLSGGDEVCLAVVVDKDIAVA